ncbi:HU family DNA-binding protein [Fusobacterium massiliense]|uniref:HU family DNA-binding protein n=1 Tax=Fusobacterium massiliense TaxID=1852365 RepID=UPI0028EA65A2|nr:HU family DNA-binding protein [Fusobacterium massiliense]
MTKKEFINAFAEKGGLKKNEAEKLVGAFLETVEEALVKGELVRFIGFGSWEVKERAAREVMNPQTKKKIKVGAKKVVKFKVGQTLADKVAANTTAKKAAKKK